MVTTTQQPVSPPRAIGRRELLLRLGAPFALLVASSFVSWPWRAVGLPSAGTLTPLGGLLLAGAVGVGVFSVRRGLPIGLITWLPVGQGAIFLLTTGFLADYQGGADVAIAAVGAYVAIFVLALIVSVLVSTDAIAWGMAFMIFFVMTQATRFPVFAADAERAVAGAEWLTLAAAARSVIETAALIWLTRRLLEAPEDERRGTLFAMVGLTMAHGFLAGWEDPLVRGVLDFTEYASQVGWWLVVAGLQLAVAFTFIRVRRMWFFEPVWAEPLPEPDPAPARKPRRERQPTEITIVDDAPAPRRRNRRKR